MLSKYDYPRPEYPRPERQRGAQEGVDWVNLNGPWQFRFDGDRVGVDERWFDPAHADWREQIIVPFCWESLAAWGEGDAAGNDHYYAMRIFRHPLQVTRLNHRKAERFEVGWYRRWVEIPEHPSWEGKRVILTVGAADFRTDGWSNGVHLGSHEGGYEPFEFDITDTLQPGAHGRRALIVLRVEDPMDNRQQPVGKQWEWYTTTSGIWQTVFLEPRSATHIRQFRILPNIDSATAHVEVGVEGGGDGLELELAITWPEGEMEKIHRLPLSGQQAAGDLDVSPLAVWDPNDPLLYRLELRLLEGRVVHDRVRSYFGMRKIDTAVREDLNAPGSLRLNNRPLYLRGALYQSYFPDGVYTAGDAGMIRNDILAAKQAGFDFLRVHIKMDDPLVYYFADTLGILLMVDFPNFGEGGDSPIARSRFERLLREGIARDFNHPSIIAWCLFNETWGFGGQTELVKHFTHHTSEKALQQVAPLSSAEAAAASKLANLSAHEWVNSIWSLAKHLDPSRLIEDMSVVHWDHLEYYQHVETDINSWHFYESDYASARAHIEKVVENTYTGSSFNYVTGYAQSNQPLINSEYGGVGALDGDIDISWSFKFLTNEMRRHPSLSAYVFTQLHDVEWECNGFLNYDRTPKQFGFDPAWINAGDVLVVDHAPIVRLPPRATLMVPVYSSHYSRRRREQVFLEWRLSGIDTTGKLHQDLARGFAPIEFPHRQVALARELRLELPGTPMLCKLTLTAWTQGGDKVAQNYVECLVAGEYPAGREEIDRGFILRARVSEWAEASWTQAASSREQAFQQDLCWGTGTGHFEWHLPVEAEALRQARRLRILCEASSRRSDTPQTSLDAYPSTLEMRLNDVQVFLAMVPDHPHDSRGSLSYLRGGKGAYGYLSYSVVEREQLQEVIEGMRGEMLRFRCGLPPEAAALGGLTVYGAECGRYPLGPTVMVEY